MCCASKKKGKGSWSLKGEELWLQVCSKECGLKRKMIQCRKQDAIFMLIGELWTKVVQAWKQILCCGFYWFHCAYTVKLIFPKILLLHAFIAHTHRHQFVRLLMCNLIYCYTFPWDSAVRLPFLYLPIMYIPRPLLACFFTQSTPLLSFLDQMPYWHA